MVIAQILSIPGFAEPLSSWLHLLSAVVVLVLGARHLARTARMASGGRFSFGMFLFGAAFVFAMSGVFHLLDHGSAEREVLRRLDYSAIWTLVAGTLTPLCFIRYRGRRALWVALGGIWSIAIVGIVLNSAFLAETPEAVSLGMYFVLAGLGFLAVRGLWGQYDLRPIAWGCVIYTVGAVAEYTRAPVIIPGVLEYHEVFHLAVMAAVMLHWRGLVQMLARERAQAVVAVGLPGSVPVPIPA